jgi:DNA-binding MarR family transcriptional regulator
MRTFERADMKDRDIEKGVPSAPAVALLLEQTARAIYDERGPQHTHPGQWAVLRYLGFAGRSARTVGGVANYLGITHAPASRAVAALARRKLVSVHVDDTDGRVRHLELTEAGNHMLQHDPVVRLASAISSVDPVERRKFAESLEVIYSRLVVKCAED